MIYKCRKCGKEFEGVNAEKLCQKHEHEHCFNDTPPISKNPYVRIFEVMKPDFYDYSPIALRCLETNIVYHDDAMRQLMNTNINPLVVEKLIGKKIRITSYAEIIE